MLNFVSYLILNFISSLLIIFFMLVGVAFLTLMERKVLSYIQGRKGPNKVGVGGIFQPLSDGVKLLSKEGLLIIFKSNYLVYYLCPILSMTYGISVWFLAPWITNIYFINYSVLFLFILLSIGGYMLLMMGWSSNSVYSLMGSIRFVAQSVSYEVSFILIVFNLMIMSESYSMLDIQEWQSYLWNMVTLFPMFVVFCISALAELNRSPFDLVEGESELVSGFNIEYFGGSFALIFLGEYSMIMFVCFLLVILFTSLFMSLLGFFMMSMGLIILIYMRGLLPRMRYDELMYMCWKVILPLVLSYLLLVFGMKFYLSLVL